MYVRALWQRCMKTLISCKTDDSIYFISLVVRTLSLFFSSVSSFASFPPLINLFVVFFFSSFQFRIYSSFLSIFDPRYFLPYLPSLSLIYRRGITHIFHPQHQPKYLLRRHQRRKLMLVMVRTLPT